MNRSVATPTIAWMTISNTNKVADWLPKTFSETLELKWFRQHFVADQFVIVSWEGCELGDDPTLPDAKPDDPRIELLWASPREIWNVVQADRVGVDIVTVTDDLLQKLDGLGRDLAAFSLDTVRLLKRDADEPRSPIPAPVRVDDLLAVPAETALVRCTVRSRGGSKSSSLTRPTSGPD